MSVLDFLLKRFWDKVFCRSTLPLNASASALAVSACGGGSGLSDTQVTGFPKSYVAPSSSYVKPTEDDPNFEILKLIILIFHVKYLIY